MEVVTDFPERLQPGTTVYLGERHTRSTISGTRSHGDGLVVKFSGIDSPEAAAELRTRQVCVKTADRPRLPQGMYYHHELVGFEVVNEAGEQIGKLSEIMQTGANDVYVVSSHEGGEVLLPAIASVIMGIDPEKRVIRIHELPGLIERQQAAATKRTPR